MKRIKKILVANRGEIAVRILRSCREHGIETVAVYSEPDASAPHVRLADEAYCVGPAPSAASYLNVEAILDAARKSGADAIHPGYGFLSERAHFVRACEAAGLIFIGPPAQAMEVMGDKVSAREKMIAAGVPVVPGKNHIRSAQAALEAAAEIGYPVMLKASAGGGGKGMRLVERERDLKLAFEAAQRESKAAFGDDRVFIERAVMRARHVEIQLMADTHGCVVALNERDCSVQRRHQKVIEEAPCPDASMCPKTRAAMGEVACQAARAVNYVGAGTVEFLFESTPEGPRYYFLEMNTRLQVEHPVTELTTGRDLVWDQIRVAQGEALGLTQSEVPLWGHAIECRVYAEDPRRFLPSPGAIKLLKWPQGPGVRVDAALLEEGEVSSHYDPMIAKLATWGATRLEAIERMERALRETVVLGIETNIPFHLRVLAEPDFRSGQFDTHYIDQHPALTAPDEPSIYLQAAQAAAVACAFVQARRGSSAVLSQVSARPTQLSDWQRAARWREGL